MRNTAPFFPRGKVTAFHPLRRTTGMSFCSGRRLRAQRAAEGRPGGAAGPRSGAAEERTSRLRSAGPRQGKHRAERSAQTPDSSAGGGGTGTGREAAPAPAPGRPPRPAPPRRARWLRRVSPKARRGGAVRGGRGSGYRHRRRPEVKRVPRVPACAVPPGLGHAGVAPGCQGVSAARLPPPARPKISQAMTAAPQGPDLGFLNEEEARAIFQVLQRDSELRRAEKDRVRYQP